MATWGITIKVSSCKAGSYSKISGPLVLNSLLKANVKALIAVFEELYPNALIGCVSPLANIVKEAMSVVTFIILLLLDFFNNGKRLASFGMFQKVNFKSLA